MAGVEPSPDLPGSFRKDLSQVNASLYTAVSSWLRKHGKGIKPKLSDEQKQQLKECFDLMDQDGSGAIDADELGAAFKLLGIRMKKAELEALLAEVDHDGSGEVEYPEFLEIMTVTLQRLAEEEDTEKNEGQVPFALMATAYRRKRLMEGIIKGDKEVQAQIQQISDKANLELLRQTKAEEVDALRAKEGGLGGPPPARGGSYGHGASGLPMRTSLGSMPSQARGSSSSGGVRRIGQLSIDKALSSGISADERRVIGQLAAKATGGARAPPPPISLVGTARPYQHFTDSPTHRQLMESPQLLDLKFMSRSTIRLPAAATGQRGSPMASMDGSNSLALGGRGSRGAAPSPGRLLRVPEASPHSAPLLASSETMRFEGSSMAYPSPKQPMGRVLRAADPESNGPPGIGDLRYEGGSFQYPSPRHQQQASSMRRSSGSPSVMLR